MNKQGIASLKKPRAEDVYAYKFKQNFIDNLRKDPTAWAKLKKHPELLAKMQNTPPLQFLSLAKQL